MVNRGKRVSIFQWMGSVGLVMAWSVCGLAMKNNQEESKKSQKEETQKETKKDSNSLSSNPIKNSTHTGVLISGGQDAPTKYSPPAALVTKMGLTRSKARELEFSEQGYWEHNTQDIPSYVLTLGEGDLVLLDGDYTLERPTDAIWLSKESEELLSKLSELEMKKLLSITSVEPADDRVLDFVNRCHEGGARVLALTEQSSLFSPDVFLQRIDLLQKSLGFERTFFVFKISLKTQHKYNKNCVYLAKNSYKFIFPSCATISPWLSQKV